MDQQHLPMVSDEPTKAIAGYHLINDLDRGDADFHAFVQDPKNAQMWHEYFVSRYKDEQQKDNDQLRKAADTEC